jgi:hypothetical protein
MPQDDAWSRLGRFKDSNAWLWNEHSDCIDCRGQKQLIVCARIYMLVVRR